MSDLRAVAEELGFTEVRTLLQSGNLVFEAKGKRAALERALEAALKRQRGIETDFLVRSAKEWRRSSRPIRFPTRQSASRAACW